MLRQVETEGAFLLEIWLAKEVANKGGEESGALVVPNEVVEGSQTRKEYQHRAQHHWIVAYVGLRPCRGAGLCGRARNSDEQRAALHRAERR